LAGALLFDEKIRQSAALFWFGLRMMEFFTYEPQSKERTIDISPAFLEHGSAKKIVV
jgi:hypothetical protein